MLSPKAELVAKNRINFVVAGVQKGGTHALHLLIAWHPRIAMSIEKELHFFDKREFVHQESAYADHHRMGWGVDGGLDADALYGELTPKYVPPQRNGVPRDLQRIRQYNPSMKLIVLLRDPADRAFSQWSMLRMNGRDVPPLEEIVETLLKTGMHERDDIIRRGDYGRLAYNLMSLFPDDQPCFVRVDDLNHQMQVFERFPGVAPHTYAYTRAYATQYESTIPEDSAALLRARYRRDLGILQRLTGVETEWWMV
jgi:hypothetical protein